MKHGKIRGEFDDYKYPFLNAATDSEQAQENKERKETAMAKAIAFAAQPERKNRHNEDSSK